MNEEIDEDMMLVPILNEEEIDELEREYEDLI